MTEKDLIFGQDGLPFFSVKQKIAILETTKRYTNGTGIINTNGNNITLRQGVLYGFAHTFQFFDMQEHKAFRVLYYDKFLNLLGLEKYAPKDVFDIRCRWFLFNKEGTAKRLEILDTEIQRLKELKWNFAIPKSFFKCN